MPSHLSFIPLHRYVLGEIPLEQLSLSPPRPPARFHLFVSRHNFGAAELIREMPVKPEVEITTCEAELRACHQHLLYLTSETWQDPERAAALTAHLIIVLTSQVPIPFTPPLHTSSLLPSPPI